MACALENGFQGSPVQQVDLVEFSGLPVSSCTRCSDFLLAVGEVVDHHDLVAGFEQLQAGVAADIARAAGDEDFHGLRSARGEDFDSRQHGKEQDDPQARQDGGGGLARIGQLELRIEPLTSSTGPPNQAKRTPPIRPPMWPQ